jgi:hypothetical protein
MAETPRQNTENGKRAGGARLYTAHPSVLHARRLHVHGCLSAGLRVAQGARGGRREKLGYDPVSSDRLAARRSLLRTMALHAPTAQLMVRTPRR